MFVHMWHPASRYADVATALSRLRATLTGHLCLTPLHTHHSKHLLDRAPLSPLIEPFLQARGYEIRSCFVPHEAIGGKEDTPEWADDPYYNRGRFSEVLVYHDDEVNLLGAQGQGERSGVLHVRDGSGSDVDRRRSRGPGRLASRLNGVRRPPRERYQWLTEARSER